jgi:hypothetical protein
MEQAQTKTTTHHHQSLNLPNLSLLTAAVGTLWNAVECILGSSSAILLQMHFRESNWVEMDGECREIHATDDVSEWTQHGLGNWSGNVKPQTDRKTEFRYHKV